MAKTPEMNADFARWYAEAFMDEGQIRGVRWKGVVDTAATADFVMTEVLVRYAFATAAPADGGKNETLATKHQSLLSTIAGNGTPMDPMASRRELQVLSAAVLARLLSTLPDAAIAVLNASFGGKRTADLPMDLAGLAKQALTEHSRLKHTRPDTKAFEIAPPKVDFQVSEEALANMAPDVWEGELNKLRDAAQAEIRSVVEGHNRVAKLLTRQIALGEEELQMLWWLIGGHSSIGNVPFAKVDASLKPLALGMELGQLTQVSPGPASLAAILSRAGLTDKAVKVVDAANAANTDWIRNITKSSRISPVTTPLHFALEKRVEVGSDEAWMPVWASMTGLPANASMPGVKLAEQFYREYLFLHVGS
jgi:hypothetical protein